MRARARGPSASPPGGHDHGRRDGTRDPAGAPEGAAGRQRHERDDDPAKLHADQPRRDGPAALADLLPGFFPADELRALIEAARVAPRAGGWLVELGSYCGRSTVRLGSVARERGLRLLAVDHHRGSIEMRPPFPWADPRLLDGDLGSPDSLGTLRDALALADLERHVTLWVGDGRGLIDLVRPVAGFVLVDGGHDARSCHLDLELARRFLVPGGLLAVHDVFEDPADGGQAPWRMLTAALHLGFDLVERTGSLAIARRATRPRRGPR
ncbi:hypothetical protein Afer_0492 [Acidimicrobium ferrooxidans DSM 10331]|uniref:Class I SAM-dependent methyltransferase n=1 Tax=Acidimicrobium ferrooxidans (strain DSM 10331 / JCM 15462 / NBRC 103882 / ICP) TaxID=525909 RepID=C7M365_ACIFD|nr:class I SAM-dependent methyltransferase [Acidimicrobium ferrooxidans]ACU53459.1 hypothetical protein Afer_0492 [Acidimicrobium ferrooxidans DSM 10331]